MSNTGHTTDHSKYKDLAPHSHADVDWEQVAVMLANGNRMRDVAAATGCSRQTIWRALRRSPKLVERVREERARLEAETSGMIDGLRTLVANGIIRLVHEGDTRVLLWLAGRLNMGRSHYALHGAVPSSRSDIDAAALEADIAAVLAAGVPRAAEDQPSGAPFRATSKNTLHVLHGGEKP